MEFKFEDKNSAHVIHLTGNLLSETPHSEFLDHTKEQIDKGKEKFIIDLSGIEYMNSAGISLLIRLLTRTRKVGGDTVLTGISEELSKILLVTKLNAVFQTYDSVQEALKELK